MRMLHLPRRTVTKVGLGTGYLGGGGFGGLERDEGRGTWLWEINTIFVFSGKDTVCGGWDAFVSF